MLNYADKNSKNTISFQLQKDLSLKNKSNYFDVTELASIGKFSVEY
jgi:hypothetical protein